MHAMEGDTVEFANAATGDTRVEGTVDWAFKNTGQYDITTEDNMYRVHDGDLLSVNGVEID